MFRRFLFVTVVAGATSVALLGGQAGAIWWSTTLPAIIDPSVNLRLAGSCIPAYAAAGVGPSGGLHYAMEGLGYSSTGNPATQVGCRFWDSATGEPYATWESGFQSGPAAALAVTFTVGTLDALVTCIKVDSVDSDTGQIDSTGWRSTDGTYCG